MFKNAVLLFDSIHGNFFVIMMTGKTYCILPSVCNGRQHDFPIILNAMIAIFQRHE